MTLQRRTGIKRTAFGEPKRDNVASHERVNLPVGWPAQYVPEEHSKNHETYFRKMVQDLAHTFGWETYHCHFPLFDEPGLPDLYMRHPKTGRRMWRELKVRAKNGKPYKPSPKQAHFIYTEVACGGDAKVWLYPDDWFSGLIDKELGL